MTKEQEEVIERLSLKSIISSSLELKDYPNMICFKKDIIEVLSMLKENSAEIEQKNTELAEKNAEIERLNRQIDLMAEEINETDRGYTDYCEMKIECDRNCKDCIKKYFERKSEE